MREFPGSSRVKGDVHTQLAGSFLNRVMRGLRSSREPLDPDETYYVRYDTMGGGAFAQLWFRTRGCSWDRSGACTMCNYGMGGAVAVDDMVGYVRAGLGSIDRELMELYVSPSGSLLDDTEVPVEARRRILQLVDGFPVGRFSFETRPETITANLIDELIRMLPNKDISVGFGLESADPWVQRYCINKPGTATRLVRALPLLKAKHIGIYSNVAVGTAFLTTAEAVSDATRSVLWSLDQGSDRVILFPLHVKSNTLLEWLADHGLYRTTSLWSLLAVLDNIPLDIIPRLAISWYRSDYGDATGVISSPTTCPECINEVLRALDSFRAEPCERTRATLQEVNCTCRDVWRAESQHQPEHDLVDRVLSSYDMLARDPQLDLREWWAVNGEHLSQEARQPRSFGSEAKC